MAIFIANDCIMTILINSSVSTIYSPGIAKRNQGFIHSSLILAAVFAWVYDSFLVSVIGIDNMLLVLIGINLVIILIIVFVEMKLNYVLIEFEEDIVSFFFVKKLEK